MNYLSTIVKDSGESLLTGAIGAGAAKVLFDPTVLYFNVPVLNYLNGFDSAWLYFGIFAGANAVQNLTGDIILPIVTKYDVKILNKLSAPISTGLISIGVTVLISGLMGGNWNIGLVGGAQAFGIGAASNIGAQWLTSFIPSKNSISIQQPSSNTAKDVRKNDFNSFFGSFGGF